jgi:membrane protein
MKLPQSRRFEKIKPYLDKVMKDNVGLLASIIAWNALTSLIPIMVGLIAISGFILRGNASLQHSVVVHLSAALQGVFTPGDLNSMVHTATRHSGLLGVIGIIGVLWGGSNVGGAISTAFQPVFETGGRNFIKEKLLDIGMIFVITILLVIIVGASTYAAVVNRIASGFPLSGASSQIIGSLISLAAGFILFSAIYSAFPNTEHRLQIRHVWVGAAVAAILFDALNFIWPIYAHFAHFSRYGAVLVPLLVLTAWLYFFSMILIVGAECVAIATLREANRAKVEIGPKPQNVVPQHTVLRET